MQYTKVANDAFQKLQMNAGIIVNEFTPASGTVGNILAATTGGISFASNPSYSDFGEDVDNVPPNTWQLKRIDSFDPVISGTAVTLSPSLAKSLVGAAVIDAQDATRIIPNYELTETDFDDIWFVGDYSDKNSGETKAGFIAIHIMNALNTTGFQLKTTKNGKGQMAFEFHGHYDLENIENVPFEIFVKAGA